MLSRVAAPREFVDGLPDLDFMMRMVKQLVELIARALKLGTQKKDEAVALLESGALTLLGIEFRTLSLVDSSSAADLLGSPTKILVFAKLLKTLASKLDAQLLPDRLQSLYRLHVT